MRAISLWQPWASLWLTDSKWHETRHWHTSYRGLLYVHAAKRPIRESDLTPELRQVCEDEFGGHFWKDLPFGHVIGMVNLIECSLTETVGTTDIDKVCGDWTRGRYAWLRAPQPVHIGPWPYKGRQGFFQINDLDEVANKALGICADA
jgi:activating signal cointegrator 1